MVLQVGLPVILLVWLARTQQPARFTWLLKTVIVLAYLVSLAVAGLWFILPWYLPWCYLIAAVMLAIRAALHVGSTAWLDTGKPRFALSSVALLFTAMASLGATAYLLSGWIPPAGPQVNLAFVLGQGTYHVVHGGSNSVLNPHLKTLAPTPRFAPWRGQSFGVDIVKTNRWGLRAGSFQPSNPQRYAIFGDRVTAPCAGKVVHAENDRPDMPVPTRDPDREKLAGNHVLLNCAGVEVLLAHLQRDSVAVNVGADVVIGDVLGLVGNSGNTAEPHLHISAQGRKPEQPLLGGEPVAILFDGNYPVRNVRIPRPRAADD
jgi:hypothetical protein